MKHLLLPFSFMREIKTRQSKTNCQVISDNCYRMNKLFEITVKAAEMMYLFDSAEATNRQYEDI
jgi:hypothetical protein